MRTLLIVFTLAIVATVYGQVIPNQYLVLIKPTLGLSGLKVHLNNVTSSSLYNPIHDSIGYQWTNAVTGYSATLMTPELVAYVKSLPEVISFENDEMVHLDACHTTLPLPSGLWGLSRISYVNRQTTDFTYHYNNAEHADGNGVDVYVVDTGILTTHVDFAGRAKIGYNAITNESPQDLNGHGTHCAGTIGGHTMGIAKRAELISVKVLNSAGSGTFAGIIDGLDWIIRNKSGTRPCVLNMSLGGGLNTALNQASDRVVEAGCFNSVAAGNSNANACNYSPASASKVFTVMASTNTDIRASFSNFGTCCDIFAPGQNILSDWIGSSNQATNTISGTSMAAPHVAGVAAARLSLYPDEHPHKVAEWMKEVSVRNYIQNPGTGSPNLLLHQGCLTK